MITREVLINRHEELIEYYNTTETSYGSQPKSLFNYDTNEFNERNWAGGDAIIRQFTNSYVFNNDSYCEEFECGNNYGDIVATSSSFNDQSYYHITLRHVEDKSGWKFTQYLVTFYKSRGKIDWIAKDGKTVNLDEYVKLLNIIAASSFKFDLKL